MKIKIKVLTPVHIGSGEEISPLEYFIDRERGQFHRLNMDSLFRDKQFRSFRDKFINEARRSRNINQIVNDQNFLRRHILYSLPISAEARHYIITNPTNIKVFIKSAGRVYLPGSSLKGSILSALLWHVIKENYSKLPNSRKQEIQDILLRRQKESSSYDDLLKKAFRWMAPSAIHDNPKFTHWLDVSDSNLALPQESLQISLVRVKGARRGGELPILFESLKENQVFYAELKPKDIVFKEEEILEIVHSFYSKVAQKDGDEKDNVKLSPGSALMRLGQGSTAFSTSFLLLAEDLGLNLKYRVSPPRTRKRIAEKIPLGFVQISPQKKS